MATHRLLLLAACAALFLGACVQEASAWGTPSPPPAPSESECRPYIEKALKEMEHHETAGSHEQAAADAESEQQAVDGGSQEEGVVPTAEGIDGASIEEGQSAEVGDSKEGGESTEAQSNEEAPAEEDQSAEGRDSTEATAEGGDSAEVAADGGESSEAAAEGGESAEAPPEAGEESADVAAEGGESAEAAAEDGESAEATAEGGESTEAAAESGESTEAAAEASDSAEDAAAEAGESAEAAAESDEAATGDGESTEEAGPEESAEAVTEGGESAEDAAAEGAESTEEAVAASGESTEEATGGESTEEEAGGESTEQVTGGESTEEAAGGESTEEATGEESAEETAGGESTEEEAGGESTEEAAAGESTEEEAGGESTEEATGEESAEETAGGESIEETTGEGSTEEAAGGESTEEAVGGESAEAAEGSESGEAKIPEAESGEAGSEGGESSDGAATESGEEAKKEGEEQESTEQATPANEAAVSADGAEQLEAPDKDASETSSSETEELPEEDLTMEIEIPDNLRPRDHISRILKLDEESVESETVWEKVADTTLRELKRLYDTAIKPLEMLYKYRDLSNRHFGDPEIFSKPLILFMGPWSGGKSTIINYLLDNEYKKFSLRTGAEPSPAYFNILMHGERSEILDGTQLAADWTFSGLQKFGQGLLDRLRGVKLNSPLLEKVNIVEIPGILEIRKQVERMFPFNDACQWFIDRADIIFLVYDPSKLDVGPETEAILDQLKGREYQTRIILNKADQVKPEELMRVQGTLIWNISPLMSSAEPPIMYSTSLWSMPYESGAPIRLLQAQEHAFLRDLREAINKRVDNKIASARRFAVRVRNHAKMVDCYLTTYYNHKTFFGNKKRTADDIIEHPQEYHIYEGLSTLTNISRYDLPDPETYRDFFKLNPLYEFQQLAATCTYFRGCPINRLDVAIAYDLPELVGKYKKNVEDAQEQNQKNQPKS